MSLNVFARKKGWRFLCYMRFVFVAFLFGAAANGVFGQDPLFRMDPDDWLAIESTQKAWSYLNKEKSAYLNHIHFDKGQLSMVPGSQGHWYQRRSDLRLVLDSLGNNLSKSHNLGFNHGAKSVFWDGRFFMLGGRGFWNNHSLFIEFVPNAGEWDLQPCLNGPREVMASDAWLEAEKNEMVVIDQSDEFTADGEQSRQVYSMSLEEGFEWRSEGRVNPLLKQHLIFNETMTFDLEKYIIWAGLHKTLVVRKSDMSSVLVDAFSMRKLQEIMNRYKAAVGFVHWISREGILSMRHHSLEGEESLILTWNIDSAYALAAAGAFPFVVAAEWGKDNPEEAALDFTAENKSIFVSLLALLMMIGAFLVGRMTRKKVVGQVAIQERVRAVNEMRTDQNQLVQGEQSAPAAGRTFSQLTKGFVDMQTSTLTTEELNAMLGLTEDLSEETRRARRAQAIRKVNQEYEMWFNQPLILRTKDEVDRRRTIYLIQRHSGNA